MNAKFSLVKRGTTDENAQHDDIGQYGKIQTPDGEVTNNKEIKKLKKEINDLKIENEILKKAMAIFTQK